MHRPLVLRSTLAAVYPRVPIMQASRRMATTPPPSSQGQSGTGQTPPAHPERSNTLIVLSALGALGGLYYYYTRGQPAVDREAARHREEETERKVRAIVEAGKNKVESAAKQGQREYDETRATVQDAAIAARTRTTEARTDLAERARRSAHEAQIKLDELKNTAERKIGDARDRSEKIMEEGKDEAEHKTRTWFGWGGSK